MAEVNTLDLTNLAKDLDQAAGNIEASIQSMLESAGNEIAAEAQNLVPVRTGTLKNSIGVVSGPGRVYVGPDVSQAPYASYVEYGTKAHEIRPKNAKVLRFKVGGQTVFATKVNHPGTKAQPYMRPAAQKWVGTLGERAADVGVDLIMGEQNAA